ncbi:uncharacterized protein LOC134225145 isoform X2 [Armigeres subalbatus]|uniref:uncharacterized protein LOC134225145 isoform X2 n=1 Tax=Armigeres subalbatus TaxID=124917 RepID=UPI002ED4563A
MKSSSSLISVADSQLHVGSSNVLVPEHEPSLAQQMLLYVYNRSGITTARQIPFWERFRQETPDVHLSARDLRSMFYREVLHEPEYFDDMDVVVEQYINPRCYQIKLEALEFSDLTEEGYVLNALPDTPPGDSTKCLSTPFEMAKIIPQSPEGALLLQFDSVNTKVETVEKSGSDVDNICDRVRALTTENIVVDDPMDAQIKSHQLLTSDARVVPKTIPTGGPTVPSVLISSRQKRSNNDTGLQSSSSKRLRMKIPPSVLAWREKAMARQAKYLTRMNNNFSLC